jgi:hypothetical protein
VRLRFAILLFALPALVFSQGGPRPGQLKVNAKDGQRYAWIPPGTFTMDCSPVDIQEVSGLFRSDGDVGGPGGPPHVSYSSTTLRPSIR